MKSPRPRPRSRTGLLAALALAAALPAWASEDCKPHPLFTPMPGYHVYSCEHSEFDAKDVPVGATPGDYEAKLETVEGIYEYVVYQVDDGATPAAPLRILRNHLDAARARGATVVWEPGRASFAASEWADIQQQIATLRMQAGGREYWVHLGSVNDGDYYAIASVSQQAMVQEVSANALGEQLAQQGMVTLDVHFDTGKASIRAESSAVLDQAAKMLLQLPSVQVEVGGHTDNVGSPAANLALSQQRAQSVRAALVERGVPQARITAKGYGDTVPVADNRSEQGRAANRRVEIRRTGGSVGAAPATREGAGPAAPASADRSTASAVDALRNRPGRLSDRLS